MRKFLLIVSLVLSATFITDARSVKGTVSCDGSSLKGVIVTDGKNFAMTNSRGRFKLELSDNADFVYVVTPAGYIADWSEGTPHFYLPAGSDCFDFSLQRYAAGEDYAVVAIADPQAQHEKHFAKFQARCSEMKSGCSSLKEPVGIALGDICWDSLHMYPDFKDEFHKLGFPMYAVIGNHDYNKENKGDHETAAEYRNAFGPENYAFGIGDDYVIVLDNIVYDTQKHYECAYTDEVLDWVEGLLDYIPESASLYIAQHAPFNFWFREEGKRFAGRGEELLEILGDRDVTFLTGHTHINNNMVISDHVKEHNIAAFCGSWWTTPHCTDGTPGGYKVYQKKSGNLSWQYISFGHDADFQVEFFNPGEVKTRPNDVIANVWDRDEAWTAEWYQDGRYMGPMQQVLVRSPYPIREMKKAYTDRGKKIPNYKQARLNDHYYAATPSQYARKVIVVVKDRSGHAWKHEYDMQKDYVDVQAHRGGAGLMPENTFSSMKNALDLGVNTLEMDLQISKDGKVVVSHDAYFHSRYSTRPDGSLVQKGEPKEWLYKMDYADIRKYDVGMRENLTWPEQECIPEVKPLAEELIPFIERYVKEHGLSPVRYNIEIKSNDGKGEGSCYPEYKEFVDKCVGLLDGFGLGDRLVIQSFDVRALEYMHEKYPELILSYLVDAGEPDFDKLMSELSFVPQWLSPHHSIVDKSFLEKCHAKGMKLVPWTVDKPEDIRRMLKIHVDAIISNYPDRVLELTRGY